MEDIKKFDANVESSIINIRILREYLELEVILIFLNKKKFKYREVDFHFKFDLERIIDDFVFICFFVGNDFIPHLPSLKIREGGIDALTCIYKVILPTLDGYITEKGKIILSRLQVMLQKLSLVEETFFKQQLSYKNYLESQNNKRGDGVKFEKKSVDLQDEEKKKNDIEIKRNYSNKNTEEIDVLVDLFDEPEDEDDKGNVDGKDIIYNVRGKKREK